MLTRLGVRACLLCMLLLIVRSNVFAQQEDGTTGILAGTVTDPDGLAVPHALVSVIAASQSFTSFVDSDRRGTYSVSDLPPGTYRVRIQADGFRDAVLYPVLVSVGHRKTFDVHLKSGPVQSIQVVEWRKPEPISEHSLLSESWLTQGAESKAQLSPDSPKSEVVNLPLSGAPPAVVDSLIAYDPLLTHHGLNLLEHIPDPFVAAHSDQARVPERTWAEEHSRWKSAEALALEDFNRQHPLAIPLRVPPSASLSTRDGLPEMMAMSRSLTVPALSEPFSRTSMPTRVAAGPGTTLYQSVSVQQPGEKHSWHWAKTTLNYFGKLGAKLRRA